MDDLEKKYLKILVSIAKDRDLFKLAKYIEDYDKVKVTSNEVIIEEVKEVVKEEVKVQPIIKPKYNITQLPEAVCDGCEG